MIGLPYAGESMIISYVVSIQYRSVAIGRMDRILISIAQQQHNCGRKSISRSVVIRHTFAPMPDYANVGSS